MPGQPVDDLTRQKILNAARSGLSRNQVARDFRVAGQTVTRICAEAGFSFDRAATETAVRARQIDLAEARTVLVKSMLAEAQNELDMLDAPFEVFAFGGSDNTFSSEVLDAAPMDVRNIAMRSAATAFDKATKALSETIGGSAATVSLIDSLEAGMTAFVAAARGETPSGDGE